MDNYRDSLLQVSNTVQYMHTIWDTDCNVSNECESLIRNVLGNGNWLDNDCNCLY